MEQRATSHPNKEWIRGVSRWIAQQLVFVAVFYLAIGWFASYQGINISILYRDGFSPTLVLFGFFFSASNELLSFVFDIILNPNRYKAKKSRSDPTSAIFVISLAVFMMSIAAAGMYHGYIEDIVYAAAGLVVGSAYGVGVAVSLALFYLKIYDWFPFTLIDWLVFFVDDLGRNAKMG